METDLSHERLDVYHVYLDVAGSCARTMSSAPHAIAAFNHLERAIESVGVNLMRANTYSPDSAQRTNCLDIAIASVHESAACLDVCHAKKVIDRGPLSAIVDKLWRVRGMLLGLKWAKGGQIREDVEPYGAGKFPFAVLDMYQLALKSVRWTHDLIEEHAVTARMRRKLDVSTTGTVLNIAEGHGRFTAKDQNRFMKIAEEHTFQTILVLDLLEARGEADASLIAVGKATQARIISILHAWSSSNLAQSRGRSG